MLHAEIWAGQDGPGAQAFLHGGPDLHKGQGARHRRLREHDDIHALRKTAQAVRHGKIVARGVAPPQFVKGAFGQFGGNAAGGAGPCGQASDQV